ncbi:hypothetical protein [Paenibacillus lutrae]|uniref:Uncharacterized protein n=1 Tax=Paenibacillus lutrae TaxID=2078573 RepID=A0A7X3FIP9_9BACL|nr:hypothetical protein [Paenibacillus lutrae]MVP00363.1 hypothetical protein [Paenibacillus lutrae]
MDEQNQMTAAICHQIGQLFNGESEDYRFDLKTMDATQFFTAMIKANAHVFNELTGDNKTVLEFTHLANHLVVQDLLEKQKN